MVRVLVPLPPVSELAQRRRLPQTRLEGRLGRVRPSQRLTLGTLVTASVLIAGFCYLDRFATPAAVPSNAPRVVGEGPIVLAADSREVADAEARSLAERGLLLRALLRNWTKAGTNLWRPCAISGGSCNCVGTLIFSTVLGEAVREVNSDGEVQCTAEALGASSHHDLKVCWCKDGVSWGDGVRKGLASLIRSGLVPRIEIASDQAAEPDCSPESDKNWHGCIMMTRRWDTTVIPQVLIRTAPPEEQLDMTLRKFDACHRLVPGASLRVLGVRSSQGGDTLEMPVSTASVCSMVYTPEQGAIWTAKASPIYCATQPGTCTTTPCDCRQGSHEKLQLRMPQGQVCWACAEKGKEFQFRVNALAQRMEGSSLSWWPPYGINCPPILWIFMDWRMVMNDCPVISMYMAIFFGFLLLRRGEEFAGGWLPWTRIAPLFGPALKRGEVWRFFTFTFFHLQFLELFQNLMTLLDTLDVEGTPAIILGDGSNLKCGVGAKQNFMCYPSIGMGSAHTLGVAIVSAAVGGMCSSWITFRGVVSGASALGFGLSGAIVALYALYAGAELDQTTSVQRSFRDWVCLRLIFVGFHLVMECIRGLSQKDAAGLLAHTAAFGAGFGYVLYFLPPMGDGTLLASGRPYIVPCAYDVHHGQYAIGTVPECIRLFSQAYEYQVPTVRHNILLLFVASVAFTIFNVVVLQAKVSSNEAMLLGGLEVSAVCCRSRAGQKPSRQTSNMEGKQLALWCEVVDVTKLQNVDPSDEMLMEIRCLKQDPRKDDGFLLDAQPVAVAKTRSMTAEGGMLELRESLFLPIKYAKGDFVQLILRDAASYAASSTALAQATLPLSRAFSFNPQDFKEQRIRLGAIGNGPSRAVACVRFRCLDLEELMRFRGKVKDELDDGRRKLILFEQHLLAMQHMAEAVPDGPENNDVGSGLQI
mmetsp:Transcript_121452/g.241912  ORF Transcript_121452/g.241912 Transcript_121452/m.241912 type:complete len:926 (+) Transcript_121452:113-2890(+)